MLPKIFQILDSPRVHSDRADLVLFCLYILYIGTWRMHTHSVRYFSNNTAVIVLSVCNRYSCCSLGQILYYYQSHFHPRTILNPHTIRAATVLLLVLIWPNSTCYRTCYY